MKKQKTFGFLVFYEGKIPKYFKQSCSFEQSNIFLEAAKSINQHLQQKLHDLRQFCFITELRILHHPIFFFK